MRQRFPDSYRAILKAKEGLSLRVETVPRTQLAYQEVVVIDLKFNANVKMTTVVLNTASILRTYSPAIMRRL